MIQTVKVKCETCRETFAAFPHKNNKTLPRFCTLCRNRRSTFNAGFASKEKRKKAGFVERDGRTSRPE